MTSTCARYCYELYSLLALVENLLHAIRCHNTQNELDIGAANLRASIELARDPRQLYQLAPESVRRQLNHTFFRKLFLDEDHGTITTRDTPTEPFEEIRDAANAYTLSHSERTSVTTKKSSVAAKTSIETRPYRLADIFRVNVSSKTVLVELRVSCSTT